MWDGHSNNKNTKYNLNYALKRLGQNNPQNKHKRAGGGAAMELLLLCVEAFFLDSGDLRRVVLDLSFEGVYFGEPESMSQAQTIIKI